MQRSFCGLLRNIDVACVVGASFAHQCVLGGSHTDQFDRHQDDQDRDE
jgi:hypothetical protein